MSDGDLSLDEIMHLATLEITMLGATASANTHIDALSIHPLFVRNGCSK